jgi:hypothetical protein
MSETQSVIATSGGLSATFILDWYERRWNCVTAFDMSEFPFVAEVDGKRFELYGDGTFNEEELAPQERSADEA